ncbi:MAG: M20/M25/M40 family metallo-hydrolase [Crocinitomicaceae bacterium]|nr:M20/M25/M40 family metallo-hydrolase [Crocinitomicaceae bacterium]
MKLLKQLIAVQATSGDESPMKEFLLEQIKTEQKNWKKKPKLFYGDGFQDALILVFGKPTTAVYAHMDSIGFTVGYDNHLIRIGSPVTQDGIELVGRDSRGEIETELLVMEHEDGEKHMQCVYKRKIDRGTPLSFKPDFRETKQFIQSPYLDNRLGIWIALQLAKTLENGVIVFSTYEEHHGGSAGFLARFLYEKFKIRQALICDITWVTDGISHGKGVAVSMRDYSIPRRNYVQRIIQIAEKNKIKYQLEVESAGGSNGTILQAAELPIDWCFVWAPENHVHSPDEKVHKEDIASMLAIYQVLMKEL